MKFGDLNLNTDTGRRELLDRLVRAPTMSAVERVSRISPLDAFGFAGPVSVLRDTLAAGVEKVDHSQLSALFAATSLQNTP